MFFTEIFFFDINPTDRGTVYGAGSAMSDGRNGTLRAAIQPGVTVDIIRKQDQLSKKRTRGIVLEILTNTAFHPHGIKVRLTDGTVGRVIAVIRTEPVPDDT